MKAIAPTPMAMPTAAPTLVTPVPGELLLLLLLLLVAAVLPVVPLPALASCAGCGEGVAVINEEVIDSIPDVVVDVDVDDNDDDDEESTSTVSVETEETSAVVVWVTALGSGEGVEDVGTPDCTVEAELLDADAVAVELAVRRKRKAVLETNSALFLWRLVLGKDLHVLRVKPGTTAVPPGRLESVPRQFVVPPMISQTLSRGQQAPFPQSMGVRRRSEQARRLSSGFTVTRGDHPSMPLGNASIVESRPEQQSNK